MKLTLPLSVLIPRKTKEDKKVILNMNVYRNLHHMTNNQAKALFKEYMDRTLPRIVRCGEGFLDVGLVYPYRFTYTLFQQSGRATDVANVLSIVDKFTCDALVELGVLPDDNHKIVKEVVYRYGGVDKENPRAELEITSL